MTAPAPNSESHSANTAENGAGPALVPELTRTELVNAIKDRWKQELENLGGISALKDLSVSRNALLDLTGAHPGGLAQFLAGRPTRLSNLIRDPANLPAARRLARTVRSSAHALAQRSGVSAAYLAIATATWTEDDQDRTVPVLLRPVAIEQLAAGEDERLTLESSVEINPVLARLLRAKGALLDTQSLARSAFATGRFDATDALNRTEALGAAVLTDFRLERKLLLGAFLHPGQHLIDDIEGQTVVLEHHEIIGALGGDRAAIQTLDQPIPPRPTRDRDPWEERGIGDLSNEQRHIVDAVASGMHLSVDVPAGGDSAGIVAGLIADATGSERSVLYVPARRHSADQLNERLHDLGLADLVLDLPPQPGARQAALEALHDDLTAAAGRTQPADLKPDQRTTAVRTQLIQAREKLAHYVDELHKRREPWDISAYDALQALGDLTSRGRAPRTRVRLSSQTVRRFNAEERLDVQNRLISAAELGAFTVGPRDTAWYGANIDTAAMAEKAGDAVHELVQNLVPTARKHVEAIASSTGLRAARTVAEWAKQLELLRGVRQSLDVFLPLVFERSASDLVAATATKQWRAEREIDMPRSVRRRLRKQAKDLVRPGRPVADLHGALVEVQAQRRAWQEQCPAGAWPRIPKGLLEIEAHERELSSQLEIVDAALVATPDGAGLRDATWDALTRRLERLDKSRDSLRDLPNRTALLRELQERGLGELLTDLANRKVAPDRVEFELQLAWWASVFEEIVRSQPELAQFDGEKLARLTRKLRDLDLAHLQSQLKPVRAAHENALHRALQQHSDQAVALGDAFAAGRVPSLRDALVRFPDVTRRLRSTWISSPALIPQILPHGRRVDLVIIDDAHSISTAQAVGAIARARQLVVLGDKARAGDSGNLFADLGELLPQISTSGAAVQRPVEVAKFQAAHDFLRGDKTLPGPLNDVRPTLHLVDGRGMPPPGESAIEGVPAEVSQVVDLVIEHALGYPHESLAIVTVSPRHAIAVREAVLAEARTSNAIQRLLEPAHGEALTICDITEADGLWRDHVILSVGYAKTPHGRVLHRFGPAAEDHGRTHLLTAVGAGRRRLSVVSSLSADDLDPERLRSPGTRALADLLDFAAGAPADAQRFSAPEEFDTAPSEEEEVTAQPDRLLLDVAERVWRRGYIVEPAYGITDGATIPLAIAHPDEPERFIVAVLTDDADYISETSIRARDRLRAAELEQLGWKVVHVWAAAAFMDPEQEVDRVEQAVISGRFPEKVHAAETLRMVPPTTGSIRIPADAVRKMNSEPAEPVTGRLQDSGRDAEPMKAATNAGQAAKGSQSGAPKVSEVAGAEAGSLQSASAKDSAPEADSLQSAQKSAFDVSSEKTDARPKTETVGPRRETMQSRPPVMRGLKISEYGDNELDSLSIWLHKTHGIETVDELVAALRKDLGLKRRGARVDTALTNAAKRALK